MINKMPNNKKILCFLPPDASEHDFEDYIKSMPGAIKREGCWDNNRRIVVELQEENSSIQKFEVSPGSNRLNIYMAEKIIFTYAVARGSNTVESKDLEDT